MSRSFPFTAASSKACSMPRRARIGERRIHTDRCLRDFEQNDDGVSATFVNHDDVIREVAHGDALIAADGIHSAVRHALYPDEGPPAWNGVMMWRGAVEYPPFLTGRSMIIAGGLHHKLVAYPVSNQTRK